MWAMRFSKSTSPSGGEWATASHMPSTSPKTWWPRLCGWSSPTCCTGRRFSGRSSFPQRREHSKRQSMSGDSSWAGTGVHTCPHLVQLNWCTHRPGPSIHCILRTGEGCVFWKFSFGLPTRAAFWSITTYSPGTVSRCCQTVLYLTQGFVCVCVCVHVWLCVLKNQKCCFSIHHGALYSFSGSAMLKLTGFGKSALSQGPNCAILTPYFFFNHWKSITSDAGIKSTLLKYCLHSCC